jgi:hypothetical protein
MTILQTMRAMPSIDTPTPAIAAGGTYTPYMAQADTAFLQMPAGNITVANPVGAQPGQILFLIIKQDGVGGRTITWGSNIKKNLALSAGANAVDLVQFVTPDGVTFYQLGSALNVS